MSSVWGEAAATMARIGFQVAAIAGSSELLANAMFDPMGATRAEAGILRAAVGPRGLAALGASLEVDSVLLKAVIAKEQHVDDLPLQQVAALRAMARHVANRVGGQSHPRAARRDSRYRGACQRDHRLRSSAYAGAARAVRAVAAIPPRCRGASAAVRRSGIRRVACTAGSGQRKDGRQCLDIEIRACVGRSACAVHRLDA